MPKRHTEQSKVNTDDKHHPFELNRQSIARIISHAPFSLSRQDGAERQRHGGTAALEAAAPGLWRPAVSRGKHARRECRKRGDRRGTAILASPSWPQAGQTRSRVSRCRSRYAGRAGCYPSPLCPLLAHEQKTYARCEVFLVCEGFRMPALCRGLPSGRDGAGVRKPPRKETASRKGAYPPHVLWDLRVASVCWRMVAMTIKDDFEG